jgi:hypothetical protein
LCLLYRSKTIIALFPFIYPTIVDTAYLGGIDKHKWMWSIQAFPSKMPTPLYSHNRRNIGPTSCRSRPYMIFLRSFGTNTTWYLHSWTVCAKLSFTCLLLSYDGHRNSGLIVGKELFFFKYYSIAFFILPGVAGGLALELFWRYNARVTRRLRARRCGRAG